MRSFLKNNRQSPRKVRLIARVVIGKRVDVALAELSYMPHKAAKSLHTLVASAYANAKQEHVNLSTKDFLIKNITVDKGMTHVRYMPRAFGHASPIHRESSHVHVFLTVLEPKEVVHTPTPSVTKEEGGEDKEKSTKTKEVIASKK